jgi:CDP-paratose 2-epimerase
MSAAMARPDLRVTSGGNERPVVITGGAGFIGTNLAHRLLGRGEAVTILDNLSRPGVDANLSWLRDTHGALLRAEIADIRDADAVRRAVATSRRVVHLAAQVAVTTSVEDPVLDFQVNALGTLNVLDALREMEQPAPLLFTSTNKVYGCLEDIQLRSTGRRHEPLDDALRAQGISESRPLDFRSPYGCSKGAADQYVLDYARTYGLQAAVFRMSCVYGPHQFGTEDQGWVAHFLIRALAGQGLTIFGDGHQVRDILFVEDLLDAIDAAFDSMALLSGQAFNIGGGPGNTTSLVELIDIIGDLVDTAPDVTFGPWRVGDQKYYVSDTARFSALTGWRPRHGVDAGLRALHAWLMEEGVPAGAAAGSGAGWRRRTAAAAAAVKR